MTEQPLEEMSKAEARRRIAAALNLIEDAQTRLSMAAETVSRVRDSRLHWDLIGKGFDQVRALWHRVNERTAAREFRMDSDWERMEETRRPGEQ